MDNRDLNVRTFAMLQQILHIMMRTLRQREIENRNVNFNRNRMQNADRARFNRRNMGFNRNPNVNRRHNDK